MKELCEKASVIFTDSHRFHLKPACPTILSKRSIGKSISLSRKPFRNDGEGNSFVTLSSDSKYLMDFFPRLHMSRPKEDVRE